MQSYIYVLLVLGVNVIDSPSDAKLIWNCRRGMLELDLILSRFVATGLKQLSARDRRLFERLLDSADPDLFSYLMGQDAPDDPEMVEIVTYIRANNSV